MVFLFLEGAWSDTFDFNFSGLSAVFPSGILEVQARLLRLQLLEDPNHSRLTHTWYSLSSIPPASSDSRFCCWGIYPSSREILGHDCSACPWPSSDSIATRLIGVSMASPVIRVRLFAGASLALLIYF